MTIDPWAIKGYENALVRANNLPHSDPRRKQQLYFIDRLNPTLVLIAPATRNKKKTSTQSVSLTDFYEQEINHRRFGGVVDTVSMDKETRFLVFSPERQTAPSGCVLWTRVNWVPPEYYKDWWLLRPLLTGINVSGMSSFSFYVPPPDNVVLLGR